MKLLPNWCLTNTKPGFYDTESGTAIEQTARVYQAMNELIGEYNKFADSWNTKIEEFISGVNSDNETFRVAMRQEFQDFIDVVELKVTQLDHYAKTEIATRITEIFNELKESDEIANILGGEVKKLEENITSLSEDVNTRFEGVADDINSINEKNTQLENSIEAVNNALNNAREEIEQEITDKFLILDEKFIGITDDLNESINTVKRDTVATMRILPFESIDNEHFLPYFKECANTWIEASRQGKVSYGSLNSTGDVDNKGIQVNPMLYAYREDGQFTSDYRDIFSQAVFEGKGTINCISLCNMLAMGIPYEYSRLNCPENIIGSAGYGFDVCKLIGSTPNEDYDHTYLVSYNPNKKLDITTFETILTQTSLFAFYRSLGLAKTVKSSVDSEDGEIWYNHFKPGDILYSGSHSRFCLGIDTDIDDSGVEVITVHFVDSSSANNPDINIGSFNVTAGVPEKTITKVARPVYTYYSGNEYLKKLIAVDYTSLINTTLKNRCKLVDGPFTKGIAANKDLNEFITPGEYRCASASNVNTLSNKPSGLTQAFRLTCESLMTSTSDPLDMNFIAQTIFSVTGQKFWRIIKTDVNFTPTSFGVWKQVTTTDL